MVLSMDRWKGKVAIVTGAGGGLGSAVVKKLLGEGLQVVALDLRSEFLDKLSNEVPNNKTNLHSFALDITQEEDVIKTFTKITSEIGPVHILVNCAGILQHTSLTEGDTQKWKKVFDLNVIALSVMTRETVKVMKSHNIDGHIVNICSLAGHRISHKIAVELNVYPASKFAVRALSETLRQEFNHLGLKIKITNVSPGFVATGLVKNCDFGFEEGSKELMSTTPMLQADDVADGILYALSTPPHVQVHELTMQAVGEIF